MNVQMHTQPATSQFQMQQGQAQFMSSQSSQPPAPLPAPALVPQPMAQPSQGHMAPHQAWMPLFNQPIPVPSAFVASDQAPSGSASMLQQHSHIALPAWQVTSHQQHQQVAAQPTRQLSAYEQAPVQATAPSSQSVGPWFTPATTAATPVIGGFGSSRMSANPFFEDQSNILDQVNPSFLGAPIQPKKPFKEHTLLD